MKYILSLFLILSCGLLNAAQKVVVILDNSSSMNQVIERSGKSRMQVAKDSLSVVLSSLNEETQVGVFILNPTREFPTSWVMDISKIQKQELTEKIYKIRPSGGTPLGAAIKMASDRLLDLRKNEKYGDYKLLIVTDGESSDPIERNLFESIGRGINVSAIGLDMSSQHVLATKISSYQDASEEKQLSLALKSSFAEIQNSDNLQDFELLASVPDEMIPKMISALNDSGNQPIGEEFVEMVVTQDAPVYFGSSPPIDESQSVLARVLWVSLTVAVVILIIAGFIAINT